MATEHPITIAFKPAGRPSASAKTSKPVSASKAHSNRWRKAMRRQSVSASGIGAAIVVLTSLSLSHLASGTTIVTHSPVWQGWALAIGIDCGFILMELACITTVSDKVRRVVERYARPAIAGTLAGSAVMNAFAFASGASTVQMKIAGSVGGRC